MNIALDAMGGDHAPQAIVAGAIEAAREYGVTISLVGQARCDQCRTKEAQDVRARPPDSGCDPGD